MEKNLENFLKLTNLLKSKLVKKKSSEEPSSNSKSHSQITSSIKDYAKNTFYWENKSDKNSKAFDNSTYKKKILDSSNETSILTILQNLKETWFESNLKYEEVKDILLNKLSKDDTDDDTVI